MERRCFSFDGLGFIFGFPVFPAFSASASLIRAFSLLFHCFVPVSLTCSSSEVWSTVRKGPPRRRPKKKRPEVPPMRASRIVHPRFKHTVCPYVFLFWREEERKEAREEEGKTSKIDRKTSKV